MKVKFNKIFGLFFGLSLLFTGCKNKEKDKEVIPEQPQSLLTPGLVSANIKEDDVYDGVLPEMTAHSDPIEIENDYFDIVDSNYRHKGLIVVRGENRYLGFYSFLHNDWLIAERLDPHDISNYYVETSNVDGVGFVLVITFKTGSQTIVDGFGNSYSIWNTYSTSYGTYVDGTYYMTFVTQYDMYYYSLNSSGVASEVSYIPTPEEIIPVEEGHDLSDVGHIVDDSWLDLEPYGFKGYNLGKDGKGNYSLFNENNKVVSSFFVDPEYTYLGVLGHKAYFQRTVEAPEDSEDYDYFDNGNKHYLSQLSVELQTGSKSDFSLAAVFEPFFSLKGSTEGEYVPVVTFSPIDGHKCLGPSESHLADKDFNIYDNVTGLREGFFTKYKFNNKDRYFNSETKILYDENLNVITYLGDVNPTYKARVNMFECSRDGKKGLVDLNGIVALSFNFTSIEYSSYCSNKILARDGADVYKLTLYKSGSQYSNYEEKLGTNLVALGGDESHFPLYRFNYSSETYGFYSPDYGVRFYTTVSATNVWTINYLGENSVTLIDEGYSHTFLLKYSDFSPSSIPAITKGTRISSPLNDGSTYEKAIEVDVTDNFDIYLPLRGLSTIYVKFIVPSSIYNDYYFVSYDRARLYCNNDYYYDVYSSYYSSYSYEAVGFNVTSSSPVTIGFTVIPSSPFRTHLGDEVQLYVDRSCGSERSHPYVYKDVGLSKSLHAPRFRTLAQQSITTYYVRFVAPSNGIYYFDSYDVNSIYLMGSDQYEDTLLNTSQTTFYLTEGESRDFKIVFNSSGSTYVRFNGLSPYATMSYSFDQTNYISYYGNFTNYLVLTFTAPKSTTYSITTTNIYNSVYRIYSLNSQVNNNYITVVAGTTYTVVVQLYNSFSDTYSDIDINLTEVPYIVSLTSPSYSYGFSEVSTGTYRSSSSAQSAMTVTFNQGGTFYFSYNKTGSGSYSTLYVWLNGSTYTSITSSGSSTSSVYVSAGDVVTFRFYSSYGYYSSYYATVSNFSLM